MRDLEMLEERVERTRNESKKAKENVAWSVVEEQKIDLEKCLQYVVPSIILSLSDLALFSCC
jgi:hypothetical protein